MAGERPSRPAGAAPISSSARAGSGSRARGRRRYLRGRIAGSRAQRWAAGPFLRGGDVTLDVFGTRHGAPSTTNTLGWRRWRFRANTPALALLRARPSGVRPPTRESMSDDNFRQPLHYKEGALIVGPEGLRRNLRARRQGADKRTCTSRGRRPERDGFPRFLSLFCKVLQRIRGAWVNGNGTTRPYSTAPPSRDEIVARYFFVRCVGATSRSDRHAGGPQAVGVVTYPARRVDVRSSGGATGHIGQTYGPPNRVLCHKKIRSLKLTAVL